MNNASAPKDGPGGPGRAGGGGRRGEGRVNRAKDGSPPKKNGFRGGRGVKPGPDPGKRPAREKKPDFAETPAPDVDASPKTAAGEIAVGLSPVKEALLERGDRLRRLCVSRSRERSDALDEILKLAKDLGRGHKTVPPGFFARFKNTAHQGVAAFFGEKPPLGLEEFLKNLPPKPPSLIVALDRVEDPGNLGAILRSAWGFGALGVIAPKDGSAGLTPVAVKTAAGGAEHVPLVTVTNLAAALDTLKERGYWLVGARGDAGEDLFGFPFPNRTVLVLGSESKGLRRLTRTRVDHEVRIPLAKGVDSLNVSAAGAVFMYAFRAFFDENRA